MKFVLGNVEEMRRDYPGFEAPPVEYREGLRPGDLAELMLLSDRMDPRGAWAQVDEVVEPGWYRGVLESGEPIDFGPEHVSDIQVPMGRGPEMGAPPVFDYIPPEEEPKKGKKPSVWETEAHAAWVEQERARKAEEAARKAKQPKRSFWDILRRKPVVELTPIPPEEMRKPRVQEELPAPNEAFPQEEEIEEEAAPPEAPPIIVPPEIEPSETIIEHGAPTSYRDILGPSGGLIVPESFPVGAFMELPAEEPKPGGLVIPAGPGELAPLESGVFEVLESPGFGPPAQIEVKPFQVIPASGPLPLETLPEETGLIISQPTEVFDVLESEERGLAPYEERAEMKPFETMPEPQELTVPQEPSAEEVEPKRKRKKKKRQEMRMSIHSSPQEWAEWIKYNFSPLENVWNHVREGREDDYYKYAKTHEEETGMWATIPIHTWNNGDWSLFARFLDIPYEEIDDYIGRMDEESEKIGYYDEAWEDFQEKVLQPISENITKAFDSLKPSDLKGNFYIGDDDSTEGQTYGIVYYEPVTKAEQKRMKREEERETLQKEQLNKGRDRELRKIWGKLPEVDEVIPWVEQMYGEDFWKSMRKNRKSEGFRKEKERAEEEGERAVLEVEPIAQEGQDLYAQLSDYFGIPTEIYDVYFKSAPFKEAQIDLWSDVLYPYFRVASKALNEVKPKSLPGYFEFGWDDDELEFFLKYSEE